MECASALRGGGYAVDFRGAAQSTVLRRMGLLDRLRALATGGASMRFVDAHDHTLLLLPPEFAGAELDVLRSELSAVLVDHSADQTEYRFDARVPDSCAAVSTGASRLGRGWPSSSPPRPGPAVAGRRG